METDISCRAEARSGRGGLGRLFEFLAASVAAIAVSCATPRSDAPYPTEETRGGADGVVTFIVTSDSHYDAFENEDRNDRDLLTIHEMNRIAERSWPEALGGGPIDAPRGVLLLGDVVDDGDRMKEGKNQTERQYAAFLEQFGFDGRDGMLEFPVFEGWGNHDGPPVGKERNGFSFQARLKERNQRRLRKGLVGALSPNGLHYSWDWGGVHFVQLNLYPADRPHPEVRYSPEYHDPQQSLSFLKRDLAENVGDSGRPVVLCHHYDLQGTDWWHDEQRAAYYDAVKGYNVVAVFHGHTGTGVYRWAPEGRDKPLDVVNTGQTENGLFVVQITPDRLRAAYRVKEGVTTTKDPDGKTRRTWSGQWGWKFLLDKPLTPGNAERPLGEWEKEGRLSLSRGRRRM